MTQGVKIKQVMNNIWDRFCLVFFEFLRTLTLYENYTWYLNMGLQNYNVLHVIHFDAHKSLHEQKQSFKSLRLSSFHSTFVT